MNEPAVWLQTLPYSGQGVGRAFDLLRPGAGHVDFEAMATVLSRIPRFGAHTQPSTLSVAQHCEQGARAILRDTGRCDWAAAFLLHDGHEYITGDIPTPIRDALVAIAIEETGDMHAGGIVRLAIDSLKRRIDAAIYPAAGIDWPLPRDTAAIIKEYDLRMAVTEHRARLADAPYAWGGEYEEAEPIRGADLEPWGEGMARHLFRFALVEFGILPR